MKKSLVILILGVIISATNHNTVYADISQYLFRPNPVSLSDCEKVKDQYGIPVCTVDNDYWVGAVMACGGIKNMPSLADYANISDKILLKMIDNYDPSFFSSYYYGINDYFIYSDTPMQKKAIDNSANFISKKFQNWKYDSNYNKVTGYSLQIRKKFASISELYSLNQEYNKYVVQELKSVREWNRAHPDDKRTFSVKSRYDYMKSAIGGYSVTHLYRDNYDLRAYAICKDDLLKYYNY